MLAIMIDIWERVSYSYIVANDQTFYKAQTLGRYMWVYTLIPLAAGISAGSFYRFHIKYTRMPE